MNAISDFAVGTYTCALIVIKMSNYSNLENFLKDQRQLLNHCRIQGSSISGTVNNNLDNLECSESDSDILDDSNKDPDWSPPQEDSEIEIENHVENENERVKRKYKELIGENTLNTEKKKRAKPGRADSSSWEKNRNKKLRMQGKRYEGLKKGADGKFAYSVQRQERTVGERHCSKRCKTCSLITEKDRLDIFNRFWKNMNWDEKKMFVIGMVEKTEAKRKKVEDSRRKYTFKYYLKKEGRKVLVCKKMFLSTLGIGERALYDWINASEEGIPDKPNKRTVTFRNPEGVESAGEFLDSLVKMPSHYCRANSSKIYLEPIFTSFNELYRAYQTYCSEKEKKETGIKGFRKIFIDKNLSLFQSKKDQCDTCVGYETKNVEEDVYREHIDRKEKAREEKTADKIRSQTSAEVKVVTLDLQAVLLCPVLKASALYYKTKLACHNFTIHEMDNHNVSCYLWHESEGELSANSFASCVSDFIDKLDDNVKELVIYSDGCTYQNRNVTLSNTLLNKACSKNITIIHKYLEKGHTQMECDSVHSTIENKIRNKPIYCPQNYVDYIKEARQNQPYEVMYLSHDFFKNYSSLNYYSSIRPGSRVGDPVVTDIRVLKYTGEGSIEYKLNYSGEFQDLPRRSKVKAPQANDTVEGLYQSQIPIKKTKFQHLQELKHVIPRDYHPFYDSLPHN